MAYLDESWIPQIEHWITVECPFCSVLNYIKLSPQPESETIVELEAMKCCSCERISWTRPLWYLRQFFEHYLTKDQDPKDFRSYEFLLNSVVEPIDGERAIITIR